MKRIGINTRLLIKNKLDGIGWYQFELLQRMVKAHPEHEFVFFFDRPYSKEFVFERNVKPIVLKPQARTPILFKFWFNQSITKALRKHQIDVFFSPDGYLSLKTQTPQVATIHDLNFEHYPDDLKPVHRKFYRSQFPLFAAKAAQIITVSEYSKSDIVDLYNQPESKVSVVYNGVHEKYSPASEEQILHTRAKYTDGVPYFLQVSSLHPRKNIARLIDAFSSFKRSTGSNHKLILAGSKFSWTNDMQAALENSGFENDIVLTGRIPQKDLYELVPGAEAIVYVSYFEGFGMPVVEGMKAGVPVITSNITSLPEVAGSAAVLVDPFSIDEIAMAMKRLASDPALREELSNKGLDHAKKFSWDKCAEETWSVIEKVLSNA